MAYLDGSAALVCLGTTPDNRIRLAKLRRYHRGMEVCGTRARASPHVQHSGTRRSTQQRSTSQRASAPVEPGELDGAENGDACRVEDEVKARCAGGTVVAVLHSAQQRRNRVGGGAEREGESPGVRGDVGEARVRPFEGRGGGKLQAGDERVDGALDSVCKSIYVPNV